MPDRLKERERENKKKKQKTEDKNSVSVKNKDTSQRTYNSRKVTTRYDPFFNLFSSTFPSI